MHVRTASLLLIACFLLPLKLQPRALTGVLPGTVTDSTGAVVPGASVVVTNQSRNVVAWRGVTGETGSYLAPALPVGV